MFYRIKVLSLALFFTSTSAIATSQNVLPKRIQANYVVTKNGVEFAKVHEQYEVVGNTYKVESTTKGIGIYALLGVRKLISTGEVTSQGLKPARFELSQGNSAKKALLTDFDWANNSLHMLVKGVNQDAVLSAGTQDLASYVYQFMFLPRPLKDNIAIMLTTGKKFNTYQYKVYDESLSVAGTSYKTAHLIALDPLKNQVETRELWLAAEKNYLLVKFLMVDEDGAKLEQTLTELHVD